MTSFAGALVLLLLTTAVASGQQFSQHPTQPDGAKAAMVALVEDCVDRAGRLAFDRAYAQEIRVQVQNLLQIYQTSDAAGLANRQARSLIFAICDTLEDVVPEVEAKRWWDFLKD